MAQTVCVPLDDANQSAIDVIVGDQSRPLKHILRTRITLLSADRLTVQEVAQQAGGSRPHGRERYHPRRGYLWTLKVQEGMKFSRSLFKFVLYTFAFEQHRWSRARTCTRSVELDQQADIDYVAWQELSVFIDGAPDNLTRLPALEDDDWLPPRSTHKLGSHSA